MNIGIFDSGNGGRFVAEKLQKLLPEHQYTVINDAANAPYGERTYDEIRDLTHAAIMPLLESCPLIVIACNTATAAAIDSLRREYPQTLFVGFEPMIKTAAEISASGRMILLATHATAHAPRTEQLIEQYAQGWAIDRLNTVGWASSIDQDKTADIDLDEVARSISQNDRNVIIIGCTHYIALQPRLERLGATILEPTEAVARRIKSLIELVLLQ